MIVANDQISSHISIFVIITSELFPYFAPFMDVTVSRERHIPCVSGGYSNTNPNEYANNRVKIYFVSPCWALDDAWTLS